MCQGVCAVNEHITFTAVQQHFLYCTYTLRGLCRSAYLFPQTLSPVHFLTLPPVVSVLLSRESSSRNELLLWNGRYVKVILPSLLFLAEKDPYPVDALPTCNHALSVCQQERKCIKLFEDFKINCKVRDGKCRMDDRWEILLPVTLLLFWGKMCSALWYSSVLHYLIFSLTARRIIRFLSFVYGLIFKKKNDTIWEI